MKKTLAVLSIILVLVLVGVAYFLYINRLPKFEPVDPVMIEKVEQESRLNDVRQRIEQKQVLTEEESIEHQARLDRIRSLQKQN